MPAHSAPLAECSPQSAVDRIAEMLANLEGYISREAAKLAEPLVEQARAEAAEQVRAAESEAQRWQDVNTELRRRLDVMQRQLAAATGKEPR